MSCEADITTAVRKEVLVIPIQALTMREVEVDGEGKYVPPPAPQTPGGLSPVVAQTANVPPAEASQEKASGSQESSAAGEGNFNAKEAEEPKPDEKKYDELQGVFVVGPDGLAHFRPIETGILGEMEVEVLEGIALGEEVVVGPLQALRTLMEYTPVVIDRTKPFRRFGKRNFGKEESGDGR
jgi:HlyD family secretion protein